MWRHLVLFEFRPDRRPEISIWTDDKIRAKFIPVTGLIWRSSYERCRAGRPRLRVFYSSAVWASWRCLFELGYSFYKQNLRTILVSKSPRCLAERIAASWDNNATRTSQVFTGVNTRMKNEDRAKYVWVTCHSTQGILGSSNGHAPYQPHHTLRVEKHVTKQSASPCDLANLVAGHVTRSENTLQVEAESPATYFVPRDWPRASHRTVHRYGW